MSFCHGSALRAIATPQEHRPFRSKRDQTNMTLSNFPESKKHMKSLVQLGQLQLGATNIDAVLLKCAQIVCFILAACVVAFGLSKLNGLDLSEVKFFGAVQQVIQTSMLFCLLGL